MFTAAFPPDFSAARRLLANWYGPTCWQLSTGPQYATLGGLWAQLTAEYHRPPGTASLEILQYLLAALLLHIGRLPRPGGLTPQAGGDAYARFHAELERSYATTRRAEDYADQLGYSVKTLTRACQADARVILQAQRLLAHTGDPIATIARQLGFTEPTNFGNFFTRRTGTSPGDFRNTHRV
ncbi:helix-turn-helix domain-containing protein [Phytohabitans rumicis]|uniref:HTH araC/xylS-type domain-containing protein n=1 Tax=Phytohabitans rumicis TaxID=1076125 RepID=A0A6V8LKR1_9ACTN|nr:hypothetical protein Prum_091100 [Phytohabitans rumicis]